MQKAGENTYLEVCMSRATLLRALNSGAYRSSKERHQVSVSETSQGKHGQKKRKGSIAFSYIFIHLFTQQPSPITYSSILHHLDTGIQHKHRKREG